MVRKSKKVVEIVETPEEIQEEIEETEELIEKTEEIEEIQELPDEITPETPKPHTTDIKEVLYHKKKISEKQQLHLQKSREIMKKREQEKKHALKKFNELQKMNVNIDELIEQAKKLQVKRQYEELYGKSNNETILEKPKIVKKYESDSDEDETVRPKKELTKQDMLRNKLRGLF